MSYPFHGPSIRQKEHDEDNDVLQLSIEANLFDSPEKSNRIVKSKRIKKRVNPFKRCREQKIQLLKSIITVPSCHIKVAETEKLVTRHNFASEIRITFKNQPFSNSLANSVNDSIDSASEKSEREIIKPENQNFNSPVNSEIDTTDVALEKSEREIIEPIQTRIIKLNNKYVQKGVHLAIAVDKSKFLSKNALKKITRNLNQMM